MQPPRRNPRGIIALIAVFVAAASGASARDISDTLGVKVAVPDHIHFLYGASPPDQASIYAVDPKLLAALTAPFNPAMARYLAPDFRKLSVVRGFLQGAGINIEALATLKPDAVLLWDEDQTVDNDTFRATLAGAHIPVLIVKHRTYDDEVAALQLVGELGDEKERAKQLAAYAATAEQAIRKAVADMPASKKLKVYLAESDDGLSSRCAYGVHGEAIRLGGAAMVPDCRAVDAHTSAEMSMEQIIADDPDVIITISPAFAHTTIKAPQWQEVKAVREGHVYLIPATSFNWLTRPPSFMRILGAEWIASLLYPERFKTDMVEETQNFYRLFLKIDLNGAEARAILEGK